MKVLSVFIPPRLYLAFCSAGAFQETSPNSFTYSNRTDSGETGSAQLVYSWGTTLITSSARMMCTKPLVCTLYSCLLVSDSMCQAVLQYTSIGRDYTFILVKTTQQIQSSSGTQLVDSFNTLFRSVLTISPQNTIEKSIKAVLFGVSLNLKKVILNVFHETSRMHSTIPFVDIIVHFKSSAISLRPGNLVFITSIFGTKAEPLSAMIR